MSQQSYVVIICVIIISAVSIYNTLVVIPRIARKSINDRQMIIGVKNNYTYDQLIAICKHNKIKYPRDTVAFYRYYYGGIHEVYEDIKSSFEI